MNDTRTLPSSLAPLFAGWFALATALAVAKVIEGRPPLVAAALIAQIAAGALAYRRLPSFRAAIEALDLRLLILFHAVRAPIGAAFLVMTTRDLLPSAFGLRGGIGDLITGVLAIAIAASAHRRRAVIAWNVLGLLDIVLTVATAQKLALVDHDPLMIRAFGYAPFGLLPFFVVPLVVLSHLAIFARLRR